MDVEPEFTSSVHSNFVSTDKEFAGFTEIVMGKPFTSDIGNLTIAGVKINPPPRKVVDKLNVAQYNVAARNCIVKGNEGIISFLEEVNNEISEIATDSTKVKLGACIQAIKLNNAQTVFLFKSSIRLVASAMHDVR